MAGYEFYSLQRFILVTIRNDIVSDGRILADKKN
jgi:hypothetical protein